MCVGNAWRACGACVRACYAVLVCDVARCKYSNHAFHVYVCVRTRRVVECCPVFACHGGVATAGALYRQQHSHIVGRLNCGYIYAHSFLYLLLDLSRVLEDAGVFAAAFESLFCCEASGRYVRACSCTQAQTILSRQKVS